MFDNKKITYLNKGKKVVRKLNAVEAMALTMELDKQGYTQISNHKDLNEFEYKQQTV